MAAGMAAFCSCRPGRHTGQTLTKMSPRGCFDIEKICWRHSFSLFSQPQPRPCQVFLVRLIKEEDPSDGVVMGRATLPDLGEVPMKSAKDLRALLCRLVHQTAFGGRPDDIILPELIDLDETKRQEILWRTADTPVWWPLSLRFQDPATCSVSKRQLKEAIVRCFWLFQEGDKLTDPLYDQAVSMFLSGRRVPEGELPLNANVHRAFYESYVVDTAEEVD